MLFWLIIILSASYQLFSQTQINELMRQETNEDFKRKRDEWIRSMHRCEEGLPYWIIDQTTKENIYNYYYSTKLDKITTKEFANGRVLGEWIEKGSDNLAGRVHTLDYDTSTNAIYLASAGGNIWKGSINGNDWVCLNNGKKFANPRMVKILNLGTKKRILVLANSPSSVFFTDDEGITWNKAKGLDNAERWGWTIRGAVTINQEIYVLLMEWNFNTWKSIVSIYKSTDLAQNFNKIYSANLNIDNWELCDIWAPSDGYNLYFVMKDTLFMVDTQNNFTIVSINSFLDKYTSGILLRGSLNNNNTFLYIAKKHNNVQTIFYVSSDGGKNFTKTGSFNFYPFEKNSFEVSKTNPAFVYFGQVEFYYSYDYGTNWKRANAWTEYYSQMETKLHADIPGILSYKKWNQSKQKLDEILFVCTDGGLYISFDLGVKYKNLSLKNLNISQYYSIYTFDKAGKVLFAGSQDQGLQICLSDSGKVLGFKQVISGDYGYLTSSNGGRFLWTTYPGFAMIVFNPQSGYFDSKSWNFVGSGFLWLPPIIADPDDPLKAYLLSGDNGMPSGSAASYIYVLTYNELTDSISYSVIPFNFALDDQTRKISSLGISPINTNIWFALSNDGKFFRSTNRGTTWEVIEGVAGPKGHYFYGNKILPSKLNVGKVVIAGSGYSNPGVLISYDTGKTFIQLDRNIPSTLFYDIEFNEDETLLFAGTEIGPFVYHFPERRWHFLGGENCPDNIFWDVEYLPNLKTIRYATYGRGIWDFKIEKVLGVEQIDNSFERELDIKLLSKNIGNDFHFQIISNPGDFLTVNIYDIEGRIVKRIWNGVVTNENMNFHWDCKSENGKSIPSGKYFCIVSNKHTAKYVSLIVTN
ncbi:MAG: hypothetical protein N2560_03450 [Ignavibacteria bacterium]|nr:hypothetical protein [Ignavibacteria bacterium]